METNSITDVEHFYTMTLRELRSEMLKIETHLGIDAQVVLGLTDGQAETLFQGRMEVARNELAAANDLEAARKAIRG